MGPPLPGSPGVLPAGQSAGPARLTVPFPRSTALQSSLVASAFLWPLQAPRFLPTFCFFSVPNMQLPPQGCQTGPRAEESSAPSLPETQKGQFRGHSGFSWEALGQSSCSASADTEQVESKLQRALCADVCIINRTL